MRVASADPTAAFTVLPMKLPAPESAATDVSMSCRALCTRLSARPMLIVSLTNDREMARSVDVMVMLPPGARAAAALAERALWRRALSHADAAVSAHATAIRLERRMVDFAW